MKIKMTTSCSGPFGSFVVGETRTVPDALGADLVRAQYAEVMDAWRTSCPRLTVWEEAVDRGLVVRRYVDGTGAIVEASQSGRDALVSHGRA